MNVREATTADAEAIARLHVASWQATYRDALPAEFLATQDVEARATRWREDVHSGTKVLLAEDEAALAGFVACGPSRDADADRVFEVYNLHVAAAHQGQGIGSSLFEAALEAARAAGATQLTLWVVDTNAEARRFYERRGMEADGAAQTHAVGPEAELHEVRYRLLVPEGPHRLAPDVSKLMEPVEVKREAKRTGWGGVAALSVILLAMPLFVVMLPRFADYLAGLASQRQARTGSLADERRAAQNEVQTLLRPVGGPANIGTDREARLWRLGMAYGRLALVEERAGDLAKRDRYFDFARRALREAGAKDPNDDFIRRCLSGGPCR